MSTDMKESEPSDHDLPEGSEATLVTRQHVEIPPSPNFFMDIKRKQNNNKVFLYLQLPGLKGSKDHRVDIQLFDCNMPVPELVDLTITRLMQYRKDYDIAQEDVLNQTDLHEFFTNG